MAKGRPYRILSAPTTEGFEKLEDETRDGRVVNIRWAAANRSWKSNTKALKQWAKLIK